MSKRSMNITSHQQNNRAKYIVLHGILIGVQFYLNLLIILDLNTYGIHKNIQNSMQYALLHDPEFAHLQLPVNNKCHIFFGFSREIVRTKTQQSTGKSSEHNRRTVF